MTKDDIIRMARSVAHPETEDPVNDGLITLTIDEMEHFAALVAAAAKAEEREECAKVCEDSLAQHYMKQIITTNDEALLLAACADCAAAIRAKDTT